MLFLDTSQTLDRPEVDVASRRSAEDRDHKQNACRLLDGPDPEGAREAVEVGVLDMEHALGTELHLREMRSRTRRHHLDAQAGDGSLGVSQPVLQ